MKSNLNSIDITDNSDQSQYELVVEGHTAVIEYARKEDRIYLTHTSVPTELAGKGIGSELVKKTLDHLRTQGHTVIPLCSFVAKYIDHNPEYASLLSDGYQM